MPCKERTIYVELKPVRAGGWGMNVEANGNGKANKSLCRRMRKHVRMRSGGVKWLSYCRVIILAKQRPQ